MNRRNKGRGMDDSVWQSRVWPVEKSAPHDDGRKRTRSEVAADEGRPAPANRRTEAPRVQRDVAPSASDLSMMDTERVARPSPSSSLWPEVPTRRVRPRNVPPERDAPLGAVPPRLPEERFQAPTRPSLSLSDIHLPRVSLPEIHMPRVSLPDLPRWMGKAWDLLPDLETRNEGDEPADRETPAFVRARRNPVVPPPRETPREVEQAKTRRSVDLPDLSSLSARVSQLRSRVPDLADLASRAGEWMPSMPDLPEAPVRSSKGETPGVKTTTPRSTRPEPTLVREVAPRVSRPTPVSESPRAPRPAPIPSRAAPEAHSPGIGRRVMAAMPFGELGEEEDDRPSLGEELRYALPGVWRFNRRTRAYLAMAPVEDWARRGAVVVGILAVLGVVPSLVSAGGESLAGLVPAAAPEGVVATAALPADVEEGGDGEEHAPDAPAVPEQVTVVNTDSRYPNLHLRSGSVVAIDAKTGHELYARDADEVRPIASLSKLMSAMVYLDTHPDLDRVVEVQKEDRLGARPATSRMYAGYKFAARDLLAAGLIASDNTAMETIIRASGLERDEFVIRMNEKAQLLGMDQSTFYDPSGLDERNVSTARGVSKMLKAAMEYPLIADLTTRTEYTAHAESGRSIHYVNSNRMARSGRWDVLGGKTGYITDAGFCLTLKLRLSDGRVVDMAFLGAPEKLSRFGDAARLASWLLSSEARDLQASL